MKNSEQSFASISIHLVVLYNSGLSYFHTCTACKNTNVQYSGTGYETVYNLPVPQAQSLYIEWWIHNGSGSTCVETTENFSSENRVKRPAVC